MAANWRGATREDAVIISELQTIERQLNELTERQHVLRGRLETAPNHRVNLLREESWKTVPGEAHPPPLHDPSVTAETPDVLAPFNCTNGFNPLCDLTSAGDGLLAGGSWKRPAAPRLSASSRSPITSTPLGKVSTPTQSGEQSSSSSVRPKLAPRYTPRAGRGDQSLLPAGPTPANVSRKRASKPTVSHNNADASRSRKRSVTQRSPIQTRSVSHTTDVSANSISSTSPDSRLPKRSRLQGPSAGPSSLAEASRPRATSGHSQAGTVGPGGLKPSAPADCPAAVEAEWTSQAERLNKLAACDQETIMGLFISPPPEVILVGDSIVRGVSIPNGITYSFSGAKVLDLMLYLPEIVVTHPTAHTIVVHASVNDVRYGHSFSKLKRDYEVLGKMIEHVLGKVCIFSGPIPMRHHLAESSSRLCAIDQWLANFCKEVEYGFIPNFNVFCKMHRLFKRDGLHPNYKGQCAFINNLHSHFAVPG